MFETGEEMLYVLQLNGSWYDMGKQYYQGVADGLGWPLEKVVVLVHLVKTQKERGQR